MTQPGVNNYNFSVVSRIVWRGFAIKTFFIVISILFSVVALFSVVSAAFNEQINYQGKLTDSSNQAVADGADKCMRFSMYTLATGGSSIWTEEWKSSTSYVETTSGLFSVMLGSQNTALATADFNQTSLYLQVDYDPNCDATYDEVFSPRKRLGAVPAAFEAEQLAGSTWASPGTIGSTTPNTGAFTTLSATGLATLSYIPQGTGVNQGSLYINPTTATADYTLLGLAVGGSEKFRIDEDGDVIIGIWKGTVVGLSYGGTSKALTASAGGIVYTDADSMEVSSGTATANKVLLSSAISVPTWSTATYPATTTINQLLYSSAANTITGLATANNGVLVTGGTGIPSIATDIPTAVTIGGAYIYRVGGTDVSVADGGTGLSSYATGDMLYASGATTLSKLTIGTTNYILTSSGTAPQWSNSLTVSDLTCTDCLDFAEFEDTLDLDANLTLNQGSYTWTQSFTGASGNAFSLSSSATSDANKTLNIAQTGATTGTDYGLYVSNTGAATTNVGLYATASGATNNYAAIFDAGNVGIGTTFAAGAPADKLTVAGGSMTIYNTASLGSEKVSNGNFATSASWTWGTNWSHDAVNQEADHTIGSSAALEQSVSAVAGEIYQVVFTVKNMTNGNVTPQVGGVNGTAVSSNTTSTQQIRATGTGNLKFIPDASNFDGSIDDVSVKLITGGDIKLAGLLTGGGTSGIKVTAAGLVGIGTANPSSSYTLDVVGAINTSTYVNTGTYVNASSDYRIGGNIVLDIYGTDTTLVGVGAGNSNTGAGNTLLGYWAGYSNTSGIQNTFIGYLAGASNETSNYNTFVGTLAGYSNSTGASNVFLGYQAGYNETGSNKLYIDNSDTSTPLIWGDFNTDDLKIYGQVEILDIATQLTLSYDATNDASFAVDSSGDLTIIPYGGDVTLGSGTEVFTVLSTGNIGIGDTSPDYPLEILSTADSQFVISYTDGSVYTTFGVNSGGDLTIDATGNDITSSDLLTLTAVPAGTGVSQGSLYINPATATTDYTLLGLAVGGSEKFRIDEDGDVVTVGNITITDLGWIGIGSSAGLIGFDNSTTDYIYFSNANVGIGTTSPGAKLQINQSVDSNIGGIYILNTGQTRSTRIWTDSSGIRIDSGSGADGAIVLNGTGTGNVGIGRTSPNVALEIQGALCVDDATDSCASGTAGTIYAEVTTISEIDLAENYLTLDNTLEAGELVSADKENPEHVVRTSSSYDNGLLGVISTKPGVLLGGQCNKEEECEGIRVPVTLAGRVPIKVSLEKGPIEIGDWLTSSSISGVAMKATRAGPIIGKALESFNADEIGKIMVFVNLGWYGGQLVEDGTLSPLGSNSQFPIPNSQTEGISLLDGLVEKIKEVLASLGLSIDNGIAQIRELVAEKIFAKFAKIKIVEVERIQMIDQRTGELYCSWLEDGEMKKAKGECDTLQFGNPVFGADPIPESELPEIEGCTDPEAKNYNSQATIPNDTCEYQIQGCMDSNALNYNPEAEIDDGLCLYENNGETATPDAEPEPQPETSPEPEIQPEPEPEPLPADLPFEASAEEGVPQSGTEAGEPES